MTTEIERRLTNALAAAAETVRDDRAPARLPGPAARPRRRRTAPRPRTWLLSAAAVAALVAALAVVATGLRPGASRPGGPATPAPTPTTSPTHSAAPSVVDGVHALTCRVSSPDPFVPALRPVSGVLPDGSVDLTGLPIDSVLPDGNVLVGTVDATPPRLDEVRPDGTRTTLWTGPQTAVGQQIFSVTAAQGDSRWISFALTEGDAGQSTITQLLVLDRADGRATAFRTVPRAQVSGVWPPTLFDGSVFWGEFDGSGRGSILRYDPATAVTSVLGRGDAIGPPTVVGGGLYWQLGGRLVTYRAGRVPAGFPIDRPKLPRTATDGTTTVWQEASGSGTVLALSRPGMDSPLTVVRSASDVLVPLAVAGPFVLYDDGRVIRALDTRTGAAGTVAPSSAPWSTAAAGGGTLALNELGSRGGANLLVARIAALPALRC